MTVECAAALWKVNPERITYTCEQGGIENAAKLSGQWIIPVETLRPVIRQIPPSSTKTADGHNKRTESQQAFVDAFKRNDAVPMGVFEHRIGNTLYRVTTCYSKKAKRTAAEVVFSMILRDEELHLSVAEQEKLKQEFRKVEIEKQPSLSDFLSEIKESLIRTKFCEEDIKMLLDKYAEAYQPLEEF